ncbi:MAG: sugar phosphate isomerase/epimerase [Planctomycetes bacterium]|nr:sugar phosphate isomerase/epimerase [Planctomycetota bacterium]
MSERSENRAEISRRQMLQSSVVWTAAVGGLPLLRSADAAVPASRAVRKAEVTFGFSFYGMRALKLDRALKVCAQIGYDSVELVATKGWPCDPQSLSQPARRDLRKQLADLGLELPALMENLRVTGDKSTLRRNLDRLKRAGELGHALSPGKPPVIETVLGGRPSQWKTRRPQFIKGLKEWAKAAEKARTVIAVKAHVGGALHTPQDAHWLINAVGSRWIRLAYDFSHFQLRGFELSKSLKLMIADSVFIHVKDKKGTAAKFQFLLPGEGDIDYRTYFKLLKQHAYRGPVMVEVSGQIHKKPGYDPVKAAQTSYKNLAGAFSAVGLTRKK